ncbi:MAG: hypothetical protein AB1898_12035 [Acidobacteriota bacterium]
MRLQIVCRGSTKEGLGHLFRARTFAKTAQYFHDVEIVAILEPELELLFGELNCSVRFARNDRAALAYLQDFDAEVLLFDLTRLDREIFEEAIGTPRLTASLSPVFEHMARLNIVFTRTAQAPQLDGVQIFGGLRYAIFNENCTWIEDDRYERNLSLPDFTIAVCMGGGDAANKTLAVLQALMRINSNLTIWALLGEGYSHSYNELVDTVRGSRRHEVILAKTNRSMWRIMGQCSLGILAGGLTTIEAIYAGLPTVNLFERQEHLDTMTQELFELGVCVNGGLFSERSLDTMVRTVQYLNDNRNRLREMHVRCKGLVDSRGSERVLQELEAELEKRPGRLSARSSQSDVMSLNP